MDGGNKNIYVKGKRSIVMCDMDGGKNKI